MAKLGPKSAGFKTTFRSTRSSPGHSQPNGCGHGWFSEGVQRLADLGSPTDGCTTTDPERYRAVLRR